jgi:hypothetical protein
MMKRFSALSFIVFAFCTVGIGWSGSKKLQSTTPTFCNEVVRIFQKNCQTCHHPGDIAPFSLMTYRDARPWARAIQEQVVLRQMPPWKAAANCGEFQDERRLTDEEISTLSRWVDGGSPEGDKDLLPEPLTFSGDWTLGEPDLILQADEDYTVRPGKDDYRCFTIPTNLRGDRFIQAVDIKPGNRNVVHHVILYLDDTGISVDLDAKDPGPGYTSFGGPGFSTTGTLGGWAPGERGRFVPEGVAWKIKAGARVVAQVHYHPRNDATEKDRTQIGLYFSRKPVKKELAVVPIVNTNFTIPAGNANYQVNAAFPVPPGFDAHAIGIAPHMHLLGKKMKIEARSTSKTDCLVDIQDWNFNWQGVYYFKKAVDLKALTLVTLNASFDNSANNPRNPNDPPKAVRWGEQTTDEMCIAFILYTLDSENLAPSTPEIAGISIEPDGRLLVVGKGFSTGADIEINGVRLKDSRNHKKAKKTGKQLFSSEDWKTLLTQGAPAVITVLNTDGVRSAGIAFTQ